MSAFAAPAPDTTPLDHLLKDVEARYNHTRTLQVSFSEQYTPVARPQRTESGTLYLRKPERMRCAYANPEGKQCVSDGNYLYLYTPSDHTAYREKLKDSFAEDMRAPLAFLLGKLNFGKEFRNLQGHPEGQATRVTGEPKNDIYQSVEFVIAPDHHIQELKITGVDRSVLDFSFTNEKLDVPLSDKLFTFQLPPGAHWDESSSQ